MFERSKFMRVRSLWKLCARAHAHSLEGTQDNEILSRNIILKFCIYNDQLPSDDGHMTSNHVSIF